MSEPNDRTTSSAHAPARLALTPHLPRTGLVDGAWWPQSRDLEAEAPGLVAAVDALVRSRIGSILRISYGIEQWDPVSARRLATPTGRVTLSGFATFGQDLVWVITRSTALSPIALLVVPPQTASDDAEDALRQASTPGSTDPVTELSAPVGRATDRANGHVTPSLTAGVAHVGI